MKGIRKNVIYEKGYDHDIILTLVLLFTDMIPINQNL